MKDESRQMFLFFGMNISLGEAVGRVGYAQLYLVFDECKSARCLLSSV